MKKLPVFMLAAALFLGGCSGEKKEAQTPAPSDTSAQQRMQQAPGQGQTNAGRSEGTTRRNREAPRQPEAPPQPTVVTRMVSVEPGAEVVASLDQKLSTATNATGSTFSATLKDGYVRNGVTLIPPGASVRGDLIASKRAARLGGRARMTLEFKDLVLPDGKTYPISADPLALEGKNTTQGDIEKIAGGAVGGAILGGILGGKSGAVKGGAAGGAGGTVWAIATRGNDIVLEPGRQLNVTLNRAVQVPVQMRSDQPNP